MSSSGFNQFGGNGGFNLFGNSTGFSNNNLFDISSILIFNSMNPQPSYSRKILINNFVVGCKEDGNWNYLDILYFFASETRQQATINWSNPSNNTITEFSSPLWTINQGYVGNGISSYLNTNYYPGINFIQNNCSAAIYSLTDIALGNVSDFGASTGTSGILMINPRNASNAFSGRLYSPNGISTSLSNSIGYFAVQRSNSNSVNFYKNSSLLASISQSSISLSSDTFFVLASNIGGGVASNFSNRIISFAMAGSGNINHPLLYNRVNTYLTLIGTI